MTVSERPQAYPISSRARHWRERLTQTVFASRTRKVAFWSATGLVILVVLVIIAAFFIDEPLRQRMEANLNRALQGYTVRIGKLDFHPIGLSLDLEDSLI